MVRITAFLLVLCLGLTACSGDGSSETKGKEVSAAHMYSEAQEFVEKGAYFRAAKRFEEIESEFPFSELAIKGQVRAAYAYYRANRFEESILIAERFLRYHPGNAEVPYAMYIRGMNYYDRMATTDRDQGITTKAKEAFEELVKRYPKSQYGVDAAKKLKLIENHLAGKEMEIGRYYLERKQFIGAANRFKKVVNDFQTTAHVPEALYRLVEVYLALGIKPEATNYASVLGHNFAASKWYKRAYKLLEK